MTAFELFMATHIAAGSLALLTGPVVMFARKRRGLHTRLGEVYHALVAYACLTAAIAAIIKWDLRWWFLPIAVGSYAFALYGYLAAKTRRGDWLRRHISGMCGSYIAMVTALLVIKANPIMSATGLGPLWIWTLPTIVGTPIIVWVNWQVSKGRLV
jgi:uncharacterized membrane protein